MSDYQPPDPIIFPPIFNSVNWPPFEGVIEGGGAGSQGPQGTQGTGGVGNQGFQGRQGNQGFQGDIGTNGNQGNQGFQGIAGTNGTSGNQGFQGLQGVQGTQGKGEIFLGENNLPVVYGSVVELGGITGIQASTLNIPLSVVQAIPTGYFNARAGTAWSLPESIFGGDYPGVRMNSTGQFQILFPDNFANFYLTKDYGRTWVARAIGGGYHACSISSTGQYIVSVMNNTGIGISTNYGTTFSQTLTTAAGRNDGQDCAISTSGQIVFANSGYDGVYRSINNGTSWTKVLSTPTTYGIGGSLIINATGQFVLSGGLGSITTSPLYYSQDYGQTWTVVSANANFGSSCFSYTGQFQLITYFDVGLGTVITRVSSDYGKTFTSTTNPPGAIKCSSTGQYIVATDATNTYYSNDFGQTYNIIYTDATRNNISPAIDGSGQYMANATRNSFGGYLNGSAGITEIDLSISRQPQHNTVLNATNTCFYLGGTGGATGFYVKPIRNGNTGGQILSYNNTSGEIQYTPRSYFAQYYDTTDQAHAGGTGQSITFNTTDFQSGISLVSGSQITVSQTGKYALSYSLQFINTDSQEQYVDVFFWKNGSVLADSNSEFAITRTQSGINGKLIASSTLFFDLVATDYLELYWYAVSTDVDLEYIAAGTYVPATPSAFVNIQLISS
jgi:hypothetical protein